MSGFFCVTVCDFFESLCTNAMATFLSHYFFTVTAIENLNANALHRFVSALVLAALAFFCFQPQPASAKCSVSVGPGFASSASVSGGSVILCASASQESASSSVLMTTQPKVATPKVATPKATQVPARTARPTEAPAPKSSCPAQVRTTDQIVAAVLAGCYIPGASAKTPVTSKPVTSNPVSELKAVSNTQTRVSTSTQNAQAVLSPRQLSVVASQSSARIEEAVLFTSDAGEHERSAVILGRFGNVRFTPIEFFWSVSAPNDSAIAVAAFSSGGAKTVSLQVSYSASTRFSLDEPWKFVGRVLVESETQVVVFDASPSTQPRAVPRLVAGSCQNRPSAYRC